MTREPDELDDAYRRLTDSVTPPDDVRGRVAARVRSRRRRRTALVAASVVVAVAGGTAVGVQALGRDGGSGEPPVTAHDTASSAPTPTIEPTPAAPTVPADLDCGDDTLRSVTDYDSPGTPLLSDLLDEFSGQHGDYVLDEEAPAMWFLRADGTAHARLDFASDTNRRWYPQGFTACADSDDTRTPVTFAPVPSLALTDYVSCYPRNTQVVRGRLDDVLGDELGDGTESPRQLVQAFTQRSDLIRTYAVGSRQVVVTIVEPSDGVELAFSAAAAPDGTWRLAALVGCGYQLPGLPSGSETTVLNRLDVGHCQVEPFSYDGRTWLPPYADQFGALAAQPERFTGLGTAQVDGDELVFTDVRGAVVRMLPADDPDAVIPADSLCD